MTFTLGRVGFDVELRPPARWELNGDRVQVSGLLSASSLADSLVLRQQLLGYAGNPDEETIPVTWSSAPSVDGFYRVNGVTVGGDKGHLVHGHLPWSAQLERVPGYALPLIESVIVGAVRDNAHGFVAGTNTRPWHAVPSSRLYYDPLGMPFTASVRASADGNINLVIDTDRSALFDAKVQWALAPASFYTGAARLEVGSTLRTVVGRQIVNETVNWRLSNGLVRVSRPTATALSVSHFAGGVWTAAKSHQLIRTGAVVSGDTRQVTVLLNSPEAAAIRLHISDFIVDLTLRRGARMVEGVLFDPQGMATTPGVGGGGAAGTAITGGARATADDAEGNRWVITSPAGHSFSNTPSARITSSSAVPMFPFGIGSEIGGSGATGESTAAQLIQQYMSAQSERMLTVGR